MVHFLCGLRASYSWNASPAWRPLLPRSELRIALGGGDPRSSARWLYYVRQLEDQHMSQTQPGETPMTPVVPGSEPAGESETQEEASPELCA